MRCERTFQSTLEEPEAIVGVIHVVHDARASSVHIVLERIGVNLVVVVAWLAELASDELLVLVLEAVWSDNNGVDGIESVVNVLCYSD